MMYNFKYLYFYFKFNLYKIFSELKFLLLYFVFNNFTFFMAGLKIEFIENIYIF